jgi:hypothetical protein
MDSITDGEGRSPGSRRVSTREGSGDWHEPGNSGHDQATPEGTGHQSQAGTHLSVLLLDDKVLGWTSRAHAYAFAKQHDGASGMDGETCEAIQAAGRER